MRLPGGIRVRLALGLVLVIGGALLVAYLIVAPSLESRLVNAKLDGLEGSAVPIAGANGFSADTSSINWQRTAAIVAVATNSRVVVLSVLSRHPLTLAVGADSSGIESAGIADDAVAVAAVAAAAPGQTAVRRSRVTREGKDYAEIAVARGDGPVVLFSASLSDTLATVRVIERRLGYASVVALSLALLLGSGAAALHARRIRRLERAAERIAQGRFDEPIVDSGDDELGELARTFERMRSQLARLDTARRAFVANASHELRTPLFALGGFIELLEDEDLDEETRVEFLASMRAQVERLAKLATDLLDLSRVDAGGLAVERVPVDLSDAARVLAGEMRGLAERSGHVLDCEAPTDVWTLGDEERVLQVGRALAGNAIAHTPPGTAITVRVREGDASAWLEVEDSGPGIPPEHLERLFERFYRVEGGAPGSGLGLAIARELAELMGGTVRVSSRPGRTVFTLELVRALGADRAERVAVTA